MTRTVTTHHGRNPPPEWTAGDNTITVMGRRFVVSREIRRTGPRSWALVVVAGWEPE